MLSNSTGRTRGRCFPEIAQVDAGILGTRCSCLRRNRCSIGLLACSPQMSGRCEENQASKPRMTRIEHSAKRLGEVERSKCISRRVYWRDAVTKVAIVTMVGNYNFGNRLQNFALQETLMGLGVDAVETLRHEATGEQGLNRLRTQWHARRSAYRENGSKIITHALKARIGRHAARQTRSDAEQQRREAISNFTRMHIFESDLAALGDSFSQHFDLAIVGSDQVWSPGYAATNDAAFLRFVPDSQRVAYAASFGVSSLPKHLVAHYRQGILEIPRVSVREERGAELVFQMTQREVPVVLDPTMLVASPKWEGLAKMPPSLEPKSYVLKFFLGAGDDERMEALQDYVKRAGLAFVDLQDESRLELYAISPLQFIGAIMGASLVVTDSFHAAAFSSIFRVPCLVRGRAGMRTRLDTLGHKLGIHFLEGSTKEQIASALDIDWDSVHTRIARERAGSIEFLRNSVA